METTTITTTDIALAQLVFAGPDAQSFLQGQLSNDVAAMIPGAAASLLAGFHSPQGRVVALLELHRPTRDEFLALLPADLADLVVTRLRRFVLRSKLQISPPAIATGGEASLSRAARIAAGLPQVYAATTEVFVAQMLNLDVIGAISFTKGCYTGQEIIARAHYRGRIKRRMQHFVSNERCQLAPGDSQRLTDGRSVQIVDACQLVDGRCEFLAVTTLPDSTARAAGDTLSPPPPDTPLLATTALELPYKLPD
jgi:tRNA-modifying protein YgfZ